MVARDDTFTFDLPPIKYRTRAFVAPLKQRAMLVAIENTGQLPFPLNIRDDLKRMIESFVDRITDAVEERNCRRLFDNYYAKVEILADVQCTKENICNKIAELGSKYTLDLATIGHGVEDPAGSGQGVLILYGGMDNWATNPVNLREDDVRGWKKRPEFQDLQLGMMYMVNCYGSKFNDAWLDLGFKTSIGSLGKNWMPEPMFTRFWLRFRNGETAQEAAQKAWEDTKKLWQFIYQPTCQLSSIAEPPYFRLSCEDNEKIKESKPEVAGEPNLRIRDIQKKARIARKREEP
jgi:hypothetical protein